MAILGAAIILPVSALIVVVAVGLHHGRHAAHSALHVLLSASGADVSSGVLAVGTKLVAAGTVVSRTVLVLTVLGATIVLPVIALVVEVTVGLHHVGHPAHAALHHLFAAGSADVLVEVVPLLLVVTTATIILRYAQASFVEISVHLSTSM